MCQELSKDAACSPAGQTTCKSVERGKGHPLIRPAGLQPPSSAPSCPALTTCQRWWSGLPSPAAAQVLGTCVRDGADSSGQMKALLQCCVTLSQHSSVPSTSHSPKRDDFGGHGLWRHPIGACQSKISCNRDLGSGGSSWLQLGHGAEGELWVQSVAGAGLAAAGGSPIFTQPLSVMSRLDTFRSLPGKSRSVVGQQHPSGLAPQGHISRAHKQLQSPEPSDHEKQQIPSFIQLSLPHSCSHMEPPIRFKPPHGAACPLAWVWEVKNAVVGGLPPISSSLCPLPHFPHSSLHSHLWTM